MVKRYELKADYDCGEMVPLSDGTYVLYSDYAHLEALIAEMAQDPMGEYYQGLRCGVEDRDIMCRYEAAEYGWQEGFEYIGSIANNSLPTRALDTKEKSNG